MIHPHRSSFLLFTLPVWIGLVVTSPPESDVRAPLQGLNPLVLDTPTDARHDLTDTGREWRESSKTSKLN